MKKVLLVWRDDKTNYNIPLRQSLIKSQVLTLKFCENREGEEITEEKSEIMRGWLMRVKESNCLCNIIVQGETGSANVEAAANYPEVLAKIINKDDYTKQKILKATFY